MKAFEIFQNFVDEMRSTSSQLDKIEILKKYESTLVSDLLYFVYHPNYQYHVTSKTINKNSDLISEDGYKLDLFELLTTLKDRSATGHEAISLVNGFISKNEKYKDLILNIIDKDLEIRANARLINKAIPNLIPEFKVALAQNYEPKLADFNDKDNRWFVSRKLDGVRCLAIVDEEGFCTLYSRMGKELLTLNKIKEAIEETGIINTIFDGEICLVDEDGNENFQGIMKELRRKDHQIKNPKYMLFDMLTKKEFFQFKSERTLSERLLELRTFVSNSDSPLYEDLSQFPLTGDDHFNVWVDLASTNNWEGIMVRKDVGYEGKRSKNLLKVKKFFDAEYMVREYDTDYHQVVRDGKEAKEEMLSQVWIRHKGHKVKVGSGFTQEQRIQYKDGSIVGKLITVQYFEETKNQEGGISLRFPTVKHIYDGERDV